MIAVLGALAAAADGCGYRLWRLPETVVHTVVVYIGNLCAGRWHGDIYIQRDPLKLTGVYPSPLGFFWYLVADGADYPSNPSPTYATFRFPPGQSQIDVNLPVPDDDTYAVTRTYFATLDPGSGVPYFGVPLTPPPGATGFDIVYTICVTH